MEDITKTGPVGLKGLSYNAESPTTNQEITPVDYLHFLARADVDALSYIPSSSVDNIGLEAINAGLGQSKYDEGITLGQLYDGNLEDIRASKQSAVSKVTNGIAKGAILAGTIFLDGTVGLLVGGAQAIKEGRWSALWDNEFSNTIQAVNEWAEEALPNYYSNQEKNTPWYENIFTANFLGDKFIKNLGFTVGAFYSGGVYAGAAKGIGKLAMTSAKKLGANISTLKTIANTSSIAASAFGAVTSAVNEGRTEALHNSKEWYDYQKAQIDDNYQRQLQEIEPYKDLNSYNYLLDKINSDYELTLAKLSEDRLKMGNADLLMNIPILMASNVIQFGKLYANGFNTARKNLNIIGSPGKYASGSTKLGATTHAIKGAASEGLEEISQRAASETAGDYYATDVNNFYAAQIDPEASQEVLSWTKAMANGINNTINDGSAWEEFFIGTLTGALGMPSFRSIRNEQGKLQSPIALEGGALGEIREYQQRKRREEEVVNYMNNRINSPEFTNYYTGLIRHQKYQNDMDRALQEGNEFDYKNAEHAQLVSDIIMFDEANKLEDLKTTINEAAGVTLEDLDAVVINTTTENNGVLVGPFSQYASKDEHGQIVANLDDIHSQGEVVYKLTSNRDDILEAINKYQKAKDSIILSVGDKVTNEQLNELTWMKMQVEDWGERSKSVVDYKIFPLIDKIIEQLSLDLSSYTAYNESTPTIEEFNINNNINVLNEIRTKKPENVPYILYKNPKIVDYLKSLAVSQDIINDNQELIDTITGIDDVLKMVKSSELYNSKFKEYTSKPENLSKDNQKSQEKQVEKASQKEKKDKIQTINNTSVSDILQQSDDGKIDLDELDAILDGAVEDEDATEAKNKIGEAKSINNTHRRLTSTGGIIDSVAGKNPEKQKAAKNAKILLSNSKSKAESTEEFLDIDREAFLDPNLLYDEEVYKELSGNTKDIQEALNNDLDAARSLIQQAKQLLNDENLSLDNIPSSGEGKVVRTLGNTGHDSTTSTIPVNNTNITNEDISPYQFVTPSISSETFEKQQEESETLAEEQYSRDLENYWKPSITEYPIHRTIGDDRPFHEILRSSNYIYYYKVGNKIKSTVYNKETVNKIEKVYNYLKNKGAFSIVNSGQIQPGEIVTFFTDKTLNNEVGEVVILIKDSKGRVIGNLTYENAEFSKYQTSLKAFRDKFIEEYEAFSATNDSEETIFEYGESTVAKNMIGKPQYTSLENMLPLNKIFSRGFKLGVAMTSGKNANIVVSPGRKKAQGQTKFERAILSPIDSVAGQSFVLLPTSRKQNGEVVNLTVPFLMAPYSEATRNTRLGKEIENIVKSFANIKTDKQAASAKFALQELLTLPDLHINLVDGNLIISLVAPNDVKQTIIYKGSPTNSNMVSQVLNKLASLNIPFQISRKYINTTFNGKDYNSMIGEIAETNLPTNTESTINEWFTINPISGGKEIKAKSPKTTGVNPNRAMPSYQEISIGDLQFTINSKTNEVLDSERRPYNGKFANHVKAKAHAIKINAKQDSVVKTDWGYYDLATDDFITDGQELQDTSNFIKEKTLKINTENNTSKPSIKKIEIVSKEAIENTWVNKNSYEYTGYEDLFEALYYSLEDAGNKYYESGYAVIDKLLEMTRKYPDHPISKIILNGTSAKEVPVGNNSSNKSTSKTPTPSRSLTNTKEKKAVFETLNTEQQNILISKSLAKQKALMDTLVTAFDGTTFDESILGTTLDNFLTETKLRESNTETYQKWNKEKELKWMQRVLPNLSTSDRLRVVEGIEGLIPIGNTGKMAYGRFRNGIIEIGRNAARGTVYHEAFHAVTHTLLSEEEKTTLFNEARNRYGYLGIIELEEKLAEDFRRYVQIGESGFSGIVNKIFRTIKHLVSQLFGKEAYIDNLFYRINRGKLANSSYKNISNKNNTIRFSVIGEIGAANLDEYSRYGSPSYNLEMARAMEAEGKSVEKIRLATNWERGADGKWRYEITDGIYNHPKDKNKEYKLQDILDNKDLYKAYPELAELPVEFESLGEKNGEYNGVSIVLNNKLNANQATSTIFHEVQHAIQHKEMFARGSSISKSDKEYINSLESKSIKLIKQFKDTPNLKLLRKVYLLYQLLRNVKHSIDAENKIYNQYFNTAGEVEARNVQRRMNMSDKERLETPLFSTEDVARKDQILLSPRSTIDIYSAEDNSMRFREANISWYEDSIEKEKKELLKAINTLKKAPTINKSIKFSDGTFKQYNPSAYLTESDAVSHVNKKIPEEIRKAYEVRTYKGRYYIVKSQDRINNEIKRLEFITNKTISEYEREIQNIKNTSNEEASRQALEVQEVYYREVEQYHRDKYDIGRLSSEDKSYIKSRGISTEEYINMSFSEKDALFRCK